MDPRERLRRLAFSQLPATVAAPGGPTVSSGPSGPSLDARTVTLVRLGALVATGGAGAASYGVLADDAVSAGATVDEVIEVLVAVAPITGPVLVVAAAPKLALALGYDTDELPDSAPPAP